MARRKRSKIAELAAVALFVCGPPTASVFNLLRSL